MLVPEFIVLREVLPTELAEFVELAESETSRFAALCQLLEFLPPEYAALLPGSPDSLATLPSEVREGFERSLAAFGGAHPDHLRAILEAV
jgi:hypothetical protein